MARVTLLAVALAACLSACGAPEGGDYDRAEVEDLAAENDELRSQVADLESQLEEARSRVQQLASSADDLRGEVDRFRTGENWRDVVPAVDSAIDEVEADTEAARDAVAY